VRLIRVVATFAMRLDQVQTQYKTQSETVDFAPVPPPDELAGRNMHVVFDSDQFETI